MLNPSSLRAALGLLALAFGCAVAAEAQVVGGTGEDCRSEPVCFNRIHPAIPMAAKTAPGKTLILHTREADDRDLTPGAAADPRLADPQFGAVHPLTGPVWVEGAEPGDVLAVTILDIEPGAYGSTLITPDGLLGELISTPLEVRWRLNRDYAVTDAIPGVRIPYAAFPGVVTVLPSPTEHARVLARETAQAAAGERVYPPHPRYASPAALCGPEGSVSQECLRTIPPREHGGNHDIRYLGVGATVYLRCQIKGCGLAVGDVHFAQGDGEVVGTAIEMDATVTLTTDLIKQAPAMPRGIHYTGPATLLNIPSKHFYATTGLPVAGEVGASLDLVLAARNALLEMIDHIERTYGLSREQAYIVASVAVDLRIGQVVDVPNVNVSAILPTDIFIGPADSQTGSHD